MAVTAFICAGCALLGWPFIDAAYANLASLPEPLLDQPPRLLARAILPGILGAYLWMVALAFLLFTLIKVETRHKQTHLHRFIFAMHVGRALLWFTAPIAVVWIVTNLYVGAL
jgi:hypothetical protein